MSAKSKLILCLLLNVFGVSQLFSQVINVDSEYFDSISENTYTYHISGYIEFDPASEFVVELAKYDSTTLTTLYSETWMLNENDLNSNGLLFSSSEGTFTLNAGDFNEMLLLHIFLRKEGLVVRELFHQSY